MVRDVQFQIIPLLGIHLTDGSIAGGSIAESMDADEEEEKEE